MASDKKESQVAASVLASKTGDHKDVAAVDISPSPSTSSPIPTGKVATNDAWRVVGSPPRKSSISGAVPNPSTSPSLSAFAHMQHMQSFMPSNSGQGVNGDGTNAGASRQRAGSLPGFWDSSQYSSVTSDVSSPAAQDAQPKAEERKTWKSMGGLQWTGPVIWSESMSGNNSLITSQPMRSPLSPTQSNTKMTPPPFSFPTSPKTAPNEISKQSTRPTEGNRSPLYTTRSANAEESTPQTTSVSRDGRATGQFRLNLPIMEEEDDHAEFAQGDHVQSVSTNQPALSPQAAQPFGGNHSPFGFEVNDDFMANGGKFRSRSKSSAAAFGPLLSRHPYDEYNGNIHSNEPSTQTAGLEDDLHDSPASAFRRASELPSIGRAQNWNYTGSSLSNPRSPWGASFPSDSAFSDASDSSRRRSSTASWAFRNDINGNDGWSAQRSAGNFRKGSLFSTNSSLLDDQASEQAVNEINISRGRRFSEQGIQDNARNSRSLYNGNDINEYPSLQQQQQQRRHSLAISQYNWQPSVDVSFQPMMQGFEHLNLEGDDQSSDQYNPELAMANSAFFSSLEEPADPNNPPPPGDLGKGVSLHQLPPNTPLYIVEFKAGRTDLFYPDGMEYPSAAYHRGDLVIVEADRGQDLGKVTVDGLTPPQVHMLQAQRQAASADPYRPPKDIHAKKIYRFAAPHEIGALMQKNQDEQKALLLCQSKVVQRTMMMDVVDAEYQWDRRKLTFYFVADRRIDFRELVRELFKIYKTRIWMCAVNPGTRK
ncbi:hypothetical protein BZG36_03099 [Bifiguratus adelaidae]|uniref:PSP1 C-terminal domain-containing protein n=1 Tax=Bifiguratus adelaidae TaxID=1938954 RepID=A0A261XZ12_9FUNG|nr:hypothetical protein BZG36_03099 [Bifiguratus adelaidae]